MPLGIRSRVAFEFKPGPPAVRHEIFQKRLNDAYDDDEDIAKLKKRGVVDVWEPSSNRAFKKALYALLSSYQHQLPEAFCVRPRFKEYHVVFALSLGLSVSLSSSLGGDDMN